MDAITHCCRKGEGMSEYRPPQGNRDWDKLHDRLQEAKGRTREDYLHRVMEFADRMEYLRWYTLSRFVRPENMNLFRDCVCALACWFDYPLEFDPKYERIRRFEDYPRQNPYAEWEARRAKAEAGKAV